MLYDTKSRRSMLGLSLQTIEKWITRRPLDNRNLKVEVLAKSDLPGAWGSLRALLTFKPYCTWRREECFEQTDSGQPHWHTPVATTRHFSHTIQSLFPVAYSYCLHETIEFFSFIFDALRSETWSDHSGVPEPAVVLAN